MISGHPQRPSLHVESTNLPEAADLGLETLQEAVDTLDVALVGLVESLEPLAVGEPESSSHGHQGEHVARVVELWESQICPCGLEQLLKLLQQPAGGGGGAHKCPKKPSITWPA